MMVNRLVDGIIRVFPRRTTYTPNDSWAFVGEPPLIRPVRELVRKVHISACFTWDLPAARRLVAAWGQYYGDVQLGGPAVAIYQATFTPGQYVRLGITFTSRGCPHACDWCLVPGREGKLVEFERVPAGYVIADNNFLACSESHRRRVYHMLGEQPRAAVFSGGLQASRVTDAIAEELRDLRINQLFLAADTDAALPPLARALRRLSFLDRKRLRVYVLCGFNGQTVEQAEARLERVWELGGMPFAQLWQPTERYIDYSAEWRALAKRWCRPAIMMARHKSEGGRYGDGNGEWADYLQPRWLCDVP